MALPGILLPSALPEFLIAGHSAQWQAPFADLPMGTGHRRKRRVCTVRPQIVNVSMFLELAQMAAFRDWFKDTLRSGELHFAARVKEQGAGLLWYDAAWLGIYQATALNQRRWQVQGQLLLTGDGESEEPALAAFSSTVSIALTGSAKLTVIKAFSSDVLIELLDAAPVDVGS